ncbi:hypothetical protein D3C81_1803190 [compost metagenome]
MLSFKVSADWLAGLTRIATTVCGPPVSADGAKAFCTASSSSPLRSTAFASSGLPKRRAFLGSPPAALPMKATTLPTERFWFRMASSLTAEAVVGVVRSCPLKNTDMGTSLRRAW